MESITVTICAPARLANGKLRAIETKTFKKSPRGLIAAVKFGDDWARQFRNQNLPPALLRAAVQVSIDGAPADFAYLSSDMRDDNGKLTAKIAAQCLQASYAI